MSTASSKTLTTQVCRAMRDAIGPADELVLLHGPCLPTTAWDYIKECLDTGWVSSAGRYVTQFENDLARTTGVARAVATVNGTAALEICLRLAGVRPNDEVLCPSLTFVATANAISHSQAVPHFIDVSDTRLSMCPESLAAQLKEVAVRGAEGTFNRHTGRRISALCLMHCFGHPADIDAISEICDRYEIELVEDAAESLGSYYKGKHTGRFGKISAVSFNGNKIITTGGGGAILTDDEELADRAKHVTTTAKVPHAWNFQHDQVAWNYRMPNINAALGVAQLEMLPTLLAAKRTVAHRYQESFSAVESVNVLMQPPDSESNYWLNTLILDVDAEEQRDDLLAALNEAGYQCRPVWQPMHQLEMYAECPRGPMPRTESLAGRILNIPSSANLSPDWNHEATA